MANTPATPPKKPASKKPSVEKKETADKKVVRVKHKKTGNEFTVSPAYLERNKSVLEEI